MTAMCRGCLTTEHLVPMDETFLASFNLITGFNLNMFDTSLYSCQTCCDAVKFCMEFRGQCIESDWSFQEMIIQEFEDDLNCYSSLDDDETILPVTKEALEVVDKNHSAECPENVLKVASENVKSKYGTDVQTDDQNVPVQPTSLGYTKNQRKKYAAKRRRAAMRQELANGTTHVLSNTRAMVLTSGGKVKMTTGSASGKTTSMVTSGGDSKKAVTTSSCAVLNLSQCQTTKRKNTETLIPDYQAAKKSKIKDSVIMGSINVDSSEDRLNVNMHKKIPEKIEKAATKQANDTTSHVNASANDTCDTQAMVISGGTTSAVVITGDVTSALVTSGSALTTNSNSSVSNHCQRHATKHTKNPGMSIHNLYLAAKKLKIEDSHKLSSITVDTSGDKTKIKKNKPNQRQRKKMAESKQRDPNKSAVIVDASRKVTSCDSKAVATSTDASVASHSNSAVVNLSQQITKFSKNPETLKHSANKKDSVNVSSTKYVSDVTLNIKKKKTKRANKKDISVVLIVDALAQAPSYAKVMTTASNDTTAVAGVKTVSMASAVTMANNSAVLKCSSGQNAKPTTTTCLQKHSVNLPQTCLNELPANRVKMIEDAFQKGFAKLDAVGTLQQEQSTKKIKKKKTSVKLKKRKMVAIQQAKENNIEPVVTTNAAAPKVTFSESRPVLTPSTKAVATTVGAVDMKSSGPTLCDASLGQDTRSITPEVHSNKERPSIRLAMLYHMSPKITKVIKTKENTNLNVSKARLTRRKKQKQLLNKSSGGASVTISDGTPSVAIFGNAASATISHSNAVTPISDNDALVTNSDVVSVATSDNYALPTISDGTPSVEISDDAALETNSDVVASVATSDNYALPTISDGASPVEISDDAALETNSDVVASVATSDNYALPTTSDGASLVEISDDAALETNSDVVASVVTSDNYALPTISDGASPVEISDDAALETNSDVVASVATSDSYALATISDGAPSEEISDDVALETNLDVVASVSTSDNYALLAISDVAPSEEISDDAALITNSDVVASVATSDNYALPTISDGAPSEEISDDAALITNSDDVASVATSDGNAFLTISDDTDLVTNSDAPVATSDSNALPTISDEAISVAPLGGAASVTTSDNTALFTTSDSSAVLPSDNNAFLTKSDGTAALVDTFDSAASVAT